MVVTRGTSTALTAVMLGTRVASLLAGLLMLAAWPGAARSATNDVEEPTGERTPRGINHETVGVELPLGSWVWHQQPGSFTENQSRVAAGGGVALRFARHRWERGYFTPIAVGLFFAEDTGYAHALTEAGLIVPGTGRRLEVGAGFGVGVLRVTYSTHCDGDCNVGGVGWMFAPVARWLFVSRPELTVGANLRAILPLTRSTGRDWFGDFSGYGSILLGGLEVGFGHL
jgi:hypothetical protein